MQEDADKARQDKYRVGGPQSTDASTNEEGENDQDNAGGDGAAVSAEAIENMIHEGVEGLSKRKFIMDADNETEQQLEDKYTSQIAASPDNAEEKDKRDAVTVGRENFLSVYKERQGGDDD